MDNLYGIFNLIFLIASFAPGPTPSPEGMEWTGRYLHLSEANVPLPTHHLQAVQ
jgi:hypothetical protein